MTEQEQQLIQSIKEMMSEYKNRHMDVPQHTANEVVHALSAILIAHERTDSLQTAAYTIQTEVR